MNEQAWNEHLQQRITELQRELHKVRVRLAYQRARAESWRRRALDRRAR